MSTRLRLTSALGGTGLHRGLLAKGFSLPFTVTASIALAYVLTANYGASGYAAFSVVAALPLLLPFADLGAGASLTSAVARDAGRHDALLTVEIWTALRRTGATSSVLAALAWALLGTGLWPSLLGGALDTEHLALATSISLSVFALTVPLSLSVRVLIGRGRNDTAVVLQSLGAVLNALLGITLASAGAPVWLVISSSTTGGLLCALAALAVVLRDPGFDLRAHLRRPQRSGTSELPAVATLVLSVTIPLAVQLDRIVLSHVSTAAVVAAYSIGAQLYAPASAIVQTTGQGAWPRVIALQQAGRPHALDFARLQRFMVVLAGVIAVGITVLGPEASRLITSGAAVASYGLMAAFGAQLLVQGWSYCSGLYLMTRDRIGLQARLAVSMLVLNVVLSVLLAKWIGAPGPVLASVLSLLIVMAVPMRILARAQMSALENA